MFEEEASLVGNSENYFLIYSIDALDNSSYESQSAAIFELEGVIDTKAFQRIRLQFQTITSRKNIEVQFHHTHDEDRSNNFIVVGGEDSTWVNGVLTRLTEIINLTRSQPNIKKVISTSGWIVAILFNTVYFRLFYTIIDSTKNEWLFLLFFIVIPFASIYFFSSLIEYLESLWPDIELQTNSIHQNTAEIKRNKMITTVTLVIIPIFLGFIYDVFKNVLHLFQ